MSSKADRLVLIVYASRDSVGNPAGGIHKAVIAQLAALRANGVQPHLLTASESCAREAADMGIETDFSDDWHNAVKPLLYPSLWVKLIRLRMRGISCVIHHSGRTWFWGGIFFVGKPNVQIFHRETVRPYRFFRRWIALTSSYADWLRMNHSLGGWRKITWAPNCLISNPERLPVKPPRDTSMPFVIGCIGRCGEGKGTGVLIRALAQVITRGHNVKLRFAGEDHPESLEEAGCLGIGDAVEFTGWHSDLAPFISSIDVLALPSLKESFGLVMIEAMVHGKPVVASACNGPLTIVEDGETGYLVPINDETALADGLEKAILNPDLEAMGLAAYERVKSRFVPAPAGARLIEALRELGADIRKIGFEQASDS